MRPVARHAIQRCRRQFFGEPSLGAEPNRPGSAFVEARGAYALLGHRLVSKDMIIMSPCCGSPPRPHTASVRGMAGIWKGEASPLEMPVVLFVSEGPRTQRRRAVSRS